MCADGPTPMDGTSVMLMRREDMVVLEFGFTNVSRVGTDGAPSLVATQTTAPALLSVVFPPQQLIVCEKDPIDFCKRFVSFLSSPFCRR